MHKFSIITILFLTLSANSAETEIEKYAITGAYNKFPFQSKKFAPAPEPSQLSVKELLTEVDKEISSIADSIFQSSPNNLGMMLIEKNKIIYENYAEGLGDKTNYFSYSMGKSLAAYTVGQAYCAGRITSLDDKAVIYAKNLEGTVFGDASIKELLTMSSGAPAPYEAGGSAKGEWRSVTGQTSSLEQILRLYGKTPVDRHQFEYNNSNTNALVYVMNGAGGFHKTFEENIWKPSKPKNIGSWLIDKNGDAYAAAGFSTTLTDWGRLSTKILNMRSGKDGACIENYMKDATSVQIKVGKGYFGDDYGYQTWVYSRQASSRFSWRGAYGQTISFDPINERVLIIFRNRNVGLVSDAVGRLMSKWEKMP